MRTRRAGPHASTRLTTEPTPNTIIAPASAQHARRLLSPHKNKHSAPGVPTTRRREGGGGAAFHQRYTQIKKIDRVVRSLTPSAKWRALGLAAKRRPLPYLLWSRSDPSAQGLQSTQAFARSRSICLRTGTISRTRHERTINAHAEVDLREHIFSSSAAVAAAAACTGRGTYGREVPSI